MLSLNSVVVALDRVPVVVLVLAVYVRAGTLPPMTLIALARSALPRPELNSLANFAAALSAAVGRPCVMPGFDGTTLAGRVPTFCVGPGFGGGVDGRDEVPGPGLITGFGGGAAGVEGLTGGGGSLLGSLNMGWLLWGEQHRSFRQP
jgi:hypothetical protein